MILIVYVCSCVILTNGKTFYSVWSMFSLFKNILNLSKLIYEDNSKKEFDWKITIVKKKELSMVHISVYIYFLWRKEQNP